MTQRPARAGKRTTALFDNLSEKLGGILDRLTGRGSLSEADVDAAMREVRRALLEADVSLDVVRSFTDRVREQAVGATVVKSVTPGQMVVKIVHDELVAVLGSDGQSIDFNAVPPVAIMMVGLQGSGKTTTTAKLARRLTHDEEMMREAAEIKTTANPHEVLLVADALTGQDAVNLARAFDQRVGLTGIVLTRVDGDGRGGAALSMRAVTGKPIKLIGTGEKTDALEDFHPSRIAGRILGMGDVVSLVERAAANRSEEHTSELQSRQYLV